MCLVLLAWRRDPEFPLVLASNRDEFRERPTAPAGWWPDAPIFAGRDELAGGTWLAVDRRGRWAAVTNVREPPRPAPRSRGELPLRFVASDRSPLPFAGSVDLAEFGPLNLLVGDRDSIAWVGNRGQPPQALGPGFHAVSNAPGAAPWPKVRRGLAGMPGAGNDPEALFALLGDDTLPPDAELPDTGFGLAWERRLAPIFLRGADYGTRCSTVLRLRADGSGDIRERRFDEAARITGESVGTWP